MKSIKSAAADFPILSEDYAYLDNAATTQKPAVVLEAVEDFYKSCNANVYRSVHRWGEEATRRYEQARRTLAAFIGASAPEELIFTSGATDGINLAADVFCRRYVRPGDEIILTEMEHHSNIVPWQIQGERAGAVLRYIPVTEEGELNLEALKRLWSPRTRLLALTHVSNVLGTVNPVEEIIGQAHARGIPVLVDGAQSVPHMGVDVKKLDCDLLVFSGHKMCGPMGTGVLYGKRELLEELPPYRGGGEMIRSVSLEGSEWNSLPHKFEAGTPNAAGAVGLAAAADYLSGLGMDVIEKREQGLTELLIRGLEDLPDYEILGTPRRRAGIAAFTHREFHAHDLAQYLDETGFALRAGQHCAHPLTKRMGKPSSMRASVYFYNTENQINGLLEALKEAPDHLF